MSSDGEAAPAVVGVADHSGWANLVTVSLGTDGTPALVDRRRCQLVPDTIPRQPYHAAASLPAEEAESLVAEVTAAAEAGAIAALATLVAALAPTHQVAAITIRTTGGRPTPDTVAEVLQSHSAMHAAEGELYREAWANAADQAGVAVHHYRRPPKGAAKPDPEADAWVKAVGQKAGPPWQADHREAAKAALKTLDDLTADGSLGK